MTTQELSALFNLAQRAPLYEAEALWLQSLMERERARIQAEQQQGQPAPAETEEAA